MMIRNRVRALYKMLLTLYPHDFKEQLGESMEQTFNDLYNKRIHEGKQGWFGIVLWMFVETAIGIFKEHVLLLTEGGAMKNSFAKTRSAAIISCIFCLPFAFLATLLILRIEPNFGPLQPLLVTPNPDQPDVLGSLIALGAILLVLAAFMMKLNPVSQTMRAGGSITAHHVNFFLPRQPSLLSQ